MKKLQEVSLRLLSPFKRKRPAHQEYTLLQGQVQRDSSLDTVKGSFEDKEKIQRFPDEIDQSYLRYIRDQLQTLQKAIKNFQPVIQSALDVV